MAKEDQELRFTGQVQDLALPKWSAALVANDDLRSAYDNSGRNRRWLSIPPSVMSIGLYIRSGQLQLPLSLVVGPGVTTRSGSKTSRHINGTGRKPAEVEGHHQQPVHWATGNRIHPLPAIGESKTALSPGRYQWHRSKVLSALADILEQERCKKHQSPCETRCSIQFIKEGEKPPASKKTKKGLLQTAPSWEMKVDLGRKLHFPQVV